MRRRLLAAGAVLMLWPGVLAAEGRATGREASRGAPASWQRLFERFDQETGGGWTYEWNALTGTPHRVSGHFVELSRPPTRATVEPVARAVLTRYRALLLVDPAALAVSSVRFVAAVRERAAGTWYIQFHQVHHAVPVRGTDVRLVIRGRRVTMMGADVFAHVAAPTSPELSAEEASAIVERDVEGLPRARETGTSPPAPSLGVVPRLEQGGRRDRLAWAVVAPMVRVPRELVMPSRTPSLEPRATEPALLPAQWRYEVDAIAGTILSRENLLSYETLSGTVTGLVHPSLPSDAAVSMPLGHLTVHAGQNAVDHTAVTDGTGQYAVAGLAPGTASLTAQLSGPDIVVHNNETPDPDTTHTAACSVPGTHDWSFAPDDPSPDDVETSAFYHANYIHDWFMRGSPFVLEPALPLNVFVNDNPICNAHGGPQEISFGDGGGICGNLALCADVVYHEYTHAISGTVYGALNVDLDAPQPAAMSEAWSDYFAASATNDPVHGGGECGDLRNIDTPDARYPEDFTGESHHDGIIFSGALWDIRGLGADYTDSLAIRALEQGATSFSEYLVAVLEEDDDPAFSPSPLANADLADGSPNIDAICHSYVDLHGIFDPVCVGHASQPVAKITSPAPAALERFDGTAPITVVGTALGSLSPLQSFALEYAAASAPNTWLSAGVTLTGGGASPVPQGALGTVDVNTLVDGAYAVRLTVVDASSQSAAVKTSFVLDRRLRSGWPQQPGPSFWGTPVVAELDPAAPGREIVAVGGDQAYVWHADGSPAPGWPQKAGYSIVASPAIADLDGDGTPELVFADEAASVRVFHANGTPAAGWPQPCPFVLNTAQPVLGDLDGDGLLEVVIGTGTGQICVRHHDGTTMAGWPVTLPGAILSSVALADLDQDGLPEMVVGAGASLHVLHGDGTPMVGWPQPLGDPAGTAPSIADLDGDGALEIVIGTTPGHVHAFHADGTVVAGWPQAIADGYPPGSSVTLADLDGDGLPEVMTMDVTRTVHAWKADGTELAASPLGGHTPYGEQPRVEAAVVGDLDGAGPAVVAIRTPLPLPSNKYYAEVRATHADGTTVAGFPLALANFAGSGAALADLDGDGHVELIALSTDGVYVWNLPGSGPAAAAPWPSDRHDLRRTGAVVPEAAVALLFDTSGSMSWRHDGTMNVPVEEQRITKAKEAAYPFLQLLHDFGATSSSFGIATFPNHPAQGCQAEVVAPMTLVTDASTQAAIATTVPALSTENSTPMLAGINAARGLFNGQSKRAIVMLSDGYHNCPSFADPSDPEVTGLIGQLQSEAVRVFTIGFGKPTDVDHPMLEAFAEQTTPPAFMGSQFYDVTGPTFDPLNWDPATALSETYKAVLVDALGLQTAADPLGTLVGGQEATRSVHLSEYDRRVSFFLSWVKAERGRLTLAVRAADGTPVTPADAGVSVHEGETYAIVTVAREYLAQTGKVGPAPWHLTIMGPGLRPGEHEKYQYSVIVDSTLRLDARVGPTAARAGRPLLVTARVTAAGRPVTGLEEVWARVSRPADGLGNWLVTPVSPAQLARVAVRRGTEPLPPRQRRALAIADVIGVPPPGYVTAARIPLFDDGTHGDAQAGDGIYTNRWTAVPHPGSYRFTIAASGSTAGGNAFDREAALGREVAIEVSTPASTISLSHTGPGAAFVTVTPRDGLGNFLGPGRSTSLRIVPAVGSMRGALDDLGDGRYRQVLVPPRGVSAGDVRLALQTVERRP